MMETVERHTDHAGAAPEGTAAYFPRVVDTEIAGCIEGLPAALIEGPRACGKTTTARHHARSEVMFGADPTARSAAEVDPRRHSSAHRRDSQPDPGHAAHAIARPQRRL